MKNLMLVFALVVMALATNAQTKTFLSVFDLPLDTVVNTATVTMDVRNPGSASETAIQVVVKELSGTTGGTVTLKGSIDGINFTPLTVRDSAAVYQTFKPTDTSDAQTFIWRITGNPVLYYRLSYTGEGTMSATISGKLLSRN